jgi:microcystin-dependent protein
MPSTYSPELRIELIAPGEQSGVWGTTTNNNIGTLLEQAIAGAATVTTYSSSYALTAFNGASDESRCAMLILSTATNTAFNVYVPPIPKLYAVRNTSAYTCTLYASSVLGNTTAAGSGIAVPPSTSVLVRCDGVNIVDQTNYISGGFLVNGNFSVNGTATLSGNPTTALQATTKQYVDAAIAAAAAGASLTGSLIMWPTTSAPSGWLLCNGASLSTTTYATLFAVVGYTFGGSGASFSLPDYRDRMPIGANTIAATIGATGGSKDAVVVSHTHSGTTNSVGDHNHSMPGSSTSSGGSGAFENRNPSGTKQTGDAGGHDHSFTTNSAGVSGTNANMTPYLGINFIIKT